jgi:hypothetical protein
MILCEYGEFIKGNTFKEYIKTLANIPIRNRPVKIDR